MEIRHMFREDIAEDISWLSEFMEILKEQRNDLLKIVKHPLFGVDKPESELDMTEPDAQDSEAETVIVDSVGKKESNSKSSIIRSAMSIYDLMVETIFAT